MNSLVQEPETFGKTLASELGTQTLVPGLWYIRQSTGGNQVLSGAGFPGCWDRKLLTFHSTQTPRQEAMNVFILM